MALERMVRWHMIWDGETGYRVAAPPRSPPAILRHSKVRKPRRSATADTISKMGKYGGLDLDRLKSELLTYVHETTPRNLSGGRFITTSNGPTCGRTRAIELTERVRPILATLYSDWRDENEASQHFEFQSERDACERLISRIESDEETSSMLSGHDAAPRLSAGDLHELVWRAATAQWSTGHRQEAVLAASKAVNSNLQTSSVAVTSRRSHSSKKPSRRASLLPASLAFISRRSRTSRRASRCDWE